MGACWVNVYKGVYFYFYQNLICSDFILKDMPGTKNPDALLIVPEFPPPRPVIQALLNCGYYFGSIAPMDSADLWWFKNIKDGTVY